MPAVKVKSMTHLPQDWIVSPDPLLDHPFALGTGKRKTKCVKATTKDITIRFGKGTTIREVVYMESTVLVGHVRGREYSTDKLILWL